MEGSGDRGRARWTRARMGVDQTGGVGSAPRREIVPRPGVPAAAGVEARGDEKGNREASTHAPGTTECVREQCRHTVLCVRKDPIAYVKKRARSAGSQLLTRKKPA